MKLYASSIVSDLEVARIADPGGMSSIVWRRLHENLCAEAMKLNAGCIERNGKLDDGATKFTLSLHVFSDEELEQYVAWRIKREKEST